jgi:hypothetical protein
VPLKVYSWGSGRIQAVFRIAYPRHFNADLVGSKRVFRIADLRHFNKDLDPLFDADLCRKILLFTLIRIWIQIMLLGARGSGRIQALFRIAYPHPFSAAPLFNAYPCRGIRLFTLMRIWIQILLLGVADQVGSSRFQDCGSASL